MDGESKRALVVDEAISWVGVQNRFQGRDRRGVDCWGLIVVTFKNALGVNWEFNEYGKIPRTRVAFSNIPRVCRRITEKEAYLGDIVLMSWSGRATHFGILVGRSFVVHASTARKLVARERLRNLRRNVAGFFTPYIYESDCAVLPEVMGRD